MANYRFRPLLGWPVSGYSAAWIDLQLKKILPEQIATLRRHGHQSAADSLEVTMCGISEAAKLYFARRSEDVELVKVEDQDPVADVLTAKEAGLALGVSDRQIRNLLTSGLLTGSNRTGRWLIPATSIEDYKLRKAAA